jgi:hypothetical protein
VTVYEQIIQSTPIQLWTFVNDLGETKTPWAFATRHEAMNASVASKTSDRRDESHHSIYTGQKYVGGIVEGD